MFDQNRFEVNQDFVMEYYNEPVEEENIIGNIHDVKKVYEIIEEANYRSRTEKDEEIAFLCYKYNVRYSDLIIYSKQQNKLGDEQYGRR